MTSNLPTSYGDDPFERYAAGGSGPQFGNLLRHNGKIGGYFAGVDNVPIELGTKLAALYEDTFVGFVYWENSRPQQALVPLRSNPDLKALRDSLGDTDPDNWIGRTAGGRPQDPWKEAVLMPVVNTETREGFGFSTNSAGGVRAARRLIGACNAEKRKLQDELQGHLPLVELGETSYPHKDRQFGTIYNPVLTLIDWVPASTIAATLQLMDIAVPMIEAKPRGPSLIEEIGPEDDDTSPAPFDVAKEDQRPRQHRTPIGENKRSRGRK